jgi:hypothetical protein
MIRDWRLLSKLEEGERLDAAVQELDRRSSLPPRRLRPPPITTKFTIFPTPKGNDSVNHATVCLMNLQWLKLRLRRVLCMETSCLMTM